MRALSRIALLAALVAAAGCSPKSRPGGAIFDDSARREAVSVPPAPQQASPGKTAPIAAAVDPDQRPGAN